MTQWMTVSICLIHRSRSECAFLCSRPAPPLPHLPPNTMCTVTFQRSRGFHSTLVFTIPDVSRPTCSVFGGFYSQGFSSVHLLIYVLFHHKSTHHDVKWPKGCLLVEHPGVGYGLYATYLLIPAPPTCLRRLLSQLMRSCKSAKPVLLVGRCLQSTYSYLVNTPTRPAYLPVKVTTDGIQSAKSVLLSAANLTYAYSILQPVLPSTWRPSTFSTAHLPGQRLAKLISFPMHVVALILITMEQYSKAVELDLQLAHINL